MTQSIRTWAHDEPVRSPFASPEGLLGRLAGLFMRLTLDMTPFVDLLAIEPGHRVLEVGFGPGVLLRALAAETEAAEIHGVDPSAEMRDAATRLNAREVRAGRVRIHEGTAERTGLSGGFDRIVSVHNVALWPDLGAGLDELAGQLAPGGRLVIAWHGGLKETRLARSLALSEAKLDELAAALRARFDSVERHELPRDVVFSSARA